MEYFLGIDQGGTKTAAAVIDEDGRILGVGKSEGAYHIIDGIEKAMHAIQEAISLATAQAGVKPDQIAAMGAGMTGMDWPEDHELLHPSLVKLTGIRDIEVYNDCIGALYSGTVKKYGAVLCAGTGMNAAVRSPKGEEFVLGFYVLDQDQGGSAFGRRAMEAVFLSGIGLRPQTALVRLFLDYAEVKTVDELLHRYSVDHAFAGSVKELVPKILDLAGEGDAVARDVTGELALGMSRYIRAGLQRFDMLDMPVDVVLSGSVFKGAGNLLTELVERSIHGFAPKSAVVNSKLEPVAGTALSALLRSRSADGREEEIMQNLLLSAAPLGLVRM